MQDEPSLNHHEARKTREPKNRPHQASEAPMLRGDENLDEGQQPPHNMSRSHDKNLSENPKFKS